MKNTQILKLQNEDKSLTYRVKPEWKEDHFNLLILLEDSNAYYADVTQEHLQNFAKQYSVDVADYYNQVQTYITQPKLDILFDIQQSDNSAELVIKRRSKQRTILFFSTKLKQLNFQESVFQLIEVLYEKNAALYKDLEASKTKQTELVKEKEASLNQLAEFVELKANWEQQIYSSFLILLNEKKRRIQFLTGLLERKNINPGEILKEEERAHIPVLSRKSPSPVQKEVETISQSESSSEYETDKEENKDDSDYDDADRDRNGPTPSTSKRNLSIDDDPAPVLCLPKIETKPKGRQLPQKVKQSYELTPKVLVDNSQSTQEIATQEPPSTQDLIDNF